MGEGHVCGRHTTHEWGGGAGGILPQKIFEI